jgi:hypothetical protein
MGHVFGERGFDLDRFAFAGADFTGCDLAAFKLTEYALPSRAREASQTSSGKSILAKLPTGVPGLEVADLLTHGSVLNQVLFAEVSFCWSAEKFVRASSWAVCS